MNEPKLKTYADLVLPPSVVSKTDLSQLVNEAEQVDNELTAGAVRAKAGGTQQTMPVISGQLDDFLRLNKLTFDTNGRSRSDLIKQLRLLKDKAPVIHMTFAVIADRESLGRLADWVRTSVHPQALIAVGLQPALVAGVYLRTPNHVHDLSLRAALSGSREVLVKELETYRAGR